MKLFEFLKTSCAIKYAIEDIILFLLGFVQVSIPVLFVLFLIKLCLIIFCK